MKQKLLKQRIRMPRGRGGGKANISTQSESSKPVQSVGDRLWSVSVACTLSISPPRASGPAWRVPLILDWCRYKHAHQRPADWW